MNIAFFQANQGTVLVVQWLRLQFPTQGAWVRFLIGKLRHHMLPSAEVVTPNQKKRLVKKRNTHFRLSKSLPPADCRYHLPFCSSLFGLWFHKLEHSAEVLIGQIRTSVLRGWLVHHQCQSVRGRVLFQCAWPDFFTNKQRCSHLRTPNFNLSMNASDISKCGYRSPIRMLSHQLRMGKLQNSYNSLCISHYVIRTIIPINISPLTCLAVEVVLSNPETIGVFAVVIFYCFQ